MQQQFSIRPVRESDTTEVLDIYRPYVLNTIISFEYEVPTVEEYLQRLRTNTADYPWLVCLHNDRIVGYAYGSRHRYRTAYQWSPESTIYLMPEYHGKGVARVLYECLFAMMRLQGYVNVFAGVALPNDKSIGFHRSLGFEEIGVFRRIGYKLGAWHDTHWFQLQLRDHATEPADPKPMHEVSGSQDFIRLLEQANRQVNEHAAL